MSSYLPMPAPRHPLHCIVPPYLLAHLARRSEPRLRAVAEAALATLVASEQLRGERRALGGVAPLLATPAGAKRRTIYDARGGSTLPGRIVRDEGRPRSRDVAVNEAYDGLGATFDLYHDAYGRNSIDDRGLRLDASVHYRERFNNAFWNGRQMVFGDGDGVIFGRFTRCIDVIGHELTHGVTQFEAGLDYEGQAGALNESFSDVFGSLVKQYALGQTAEQADWLIGAGLFAAGVKGRALRSMRAPGTAYDDPRIGRDPQPAHMRDYVDTTDDNGGVHINSGIPNRAFCMAATSLGGQAWKQAGAIWYRALTDVLRGASNFQEAAAATTRVAGTDFGTDAAARVREAWKAVGVVVRAPSGTRRKEPSSANSNRAERRSRRPPSRADRRNGASARRRA